MYGALAQLQRSPRDSALWREAQEQILGGNHGPALPIYRRLTKRYSSVAELWYELGNAAMGELDFKLANQAYRRAAALAQNDANLLGMLARQYLGLRQLEDTRACLERAVAAAPDAVDGLINMAVWFERERRLDEAWECVETCLAKHPGDDLMGIWLRMRDLAGFDWIETHYEDVVNDLGQEGRKVTSFLGQSWHADQGQYQETARKKFLFAPTYHDVTNRYIEAQWDDGKTMPKHWSRYRHNWLHIAKHLATRHKRNG